MSLHCNGFGASVLCLAFAVTTQGTKPVASTCTDLTEFPPFKLFIPKKTFYFLQFLDKISEIHFREQFNDENSYPFSFCVFFIFY